jgi:hypothetical protein
MLFAGYADTIQIARVQKDVGDKQFKNHMFGTQIMG